MEKLLFSLLNTPVRLEWWLIVDDPSVDGHEKTVENGTCR